MSKWIINKVFALIIYQKSKFYQHFRRIENKLVQIIKILTYLLVFETILQNQYIQWCKDGKNKSSKTGVFLNVDHAQLFYFLLVFALLFVGFCTAQSIIIGKKTRSTLQENNNNNNAPPFSSENGTSRSRDPCTALSDRLIYRWP